MIRPGLVGKWQREFGRLSREHAPCPLLRRWPAVCRIADRFLAVHAEAALGLGWTALDLFGVHHLVGTIRLDCSGALMLCEGSAVTEIAADLIRFENGLAYRRHPWPPGDQVVAVWEFSR